MPSRLAIMLSLVPISTSVAISGIDPGGSGTRV